MELFNFLEWNIQIIATYEHWAVIKTFNNNFRSSNFNKEAIRDSAFSFWLAFLQRDSTCGSKKDFT